MARIVYAPAALSDLERLTDFLLDESPTIASETVGLITTAIAILENHPLIGRHAEKDLRELVISRGRSGYLALYDYHSSLDTVIVLAIRHQREAGYPQ